MVEPETPTADAPPDTVDDGEPDGPPGAFDDTAHRLRSLADDLHNQITAARVDSMSSDKWLARLASIETRLSMVESSVRAEAERLRASIATLDDLAASVAHHLDRAVGTVSSISEGLGEQLERIEDSLERIGERQADSAGAVAAAVSTSLQAGAERIDAALAPLTSAPDVVPLVDELRSTILGEVAAVRAELEEHVGQAVDDLGARLNATGMELASGVGALRRELEPVGEMSATVEGVSANLDGLSATVDGLAVTVEKLLAASQTDQGSVALGNLDLALREQLADHAEVLRGLQASTEAAAANVEAMGSSTTSEVARLADRIAALSGEVEVLRQAAHRPEIVAEPSTDTDRELEVMGAQLDALGRLMHLVVRSVQLVEEATVGVSDDREDDWAAAAAAISRLRALRDAGSA